MRYIYGNDTGKHWQAYCEWDVTGETNDTVTITANCYFRSLSWGFSIGYVNGGITIDGNQNYTTNNSVEIGNGKTENVWLVRHTVTLVKGNSPRDIKVSCAVRNNSGYMGGYSTGEVNYTVPAKTITKFTVSYDANGGTDAPAAQTKTKGQALTLSSQKPTRSGYIFMGWSNNRNGTVAYPAGGKYTNDANATLYAVWEYDSASQPTILTASVYRVASKSSTTQAADGNYVYFSISWTSGANITTCKMNYTSDGMFTNQATLNGATSGASGTTYGWCDCPSSLTWHLTFTLANSYGQSIEADYTIAAYGTAIIDVTNQGQGVGILTAAPNQGVAIGGTG
ncbi:hypothetical protein EVA_10892, partial [gut metagenome]